MADLRPDFRTEGQRPGRYVFYAEPPAGKYVEITDPVEVERWAVGFQRWIRETEAMIARKKAGKPAFLDWRATIAEMTNHLEELRSEMRTATRRRLFVLPFLKEKAHG